jgi:hypothetical protein
MFNLFLLPGSNLAYYKPRTHATKQHKFKFLNFPCPELLVLQARLASKAIQPTRLIILFLN